MRTRNLRPGRDYWVACEKLSLPTVLFIWTHTETKRTSGSRLWNAQRAATGPVGVYLSDTETTLFSICGWGWARIKRRTYGIPFSSWIHKAELYLRQRSRRVEHEAFFVTA